MVQMFCLKLQVLEPREATFLSKPQPRLQIADTLFSCHS